MQMTLDLNDVGGLNSLKENNTSQILKLKQKI
jgi:hypothetical protein